MDLEAIYQFVINGAQDDAENGVRELIKQGVLPETILQESLIPAMDEIGNLFERLEIYLPEMLVSARAMQASMDVLRPLLMEEGIEPIGRVVIGTVKGDLHDLGKNLVSMMLEGAGFEVLDLGVDVPSEKFIEAVVGGAEIMGLSALVTTTMPAMKDVIEAINAANLRDQVKIIVGGAPVTQEFAYSIGADGYSSDAGGAVKAVRQLLG